jgi:hypothetical protein
MNDTTFQNGTADSTQPVIPPDAAVDQPRAWEMIENGRYQPRRIKGSCLGRELGWTFVVPPGPGGFAEGK